MDKMTTYWMAAYPSVGKMVARITGARRMGSESTAVHYVIGVRMFTRFVGRESPEEVLADLRSGKADLVKSVDGFIEEEMNEGKAPSTVLVLVMGIKKWAEVNELDLGRWKTIEMPRNLVLESDRAPTKAELRMICDAQPLRDRTITVVDVSSGLRVETLLGLRWSDVDFESYPDIAKITVLRKPGRKFTGSQNYYVTFITPEARRVLELYRKSLGAVKEEDYVWRDRWGKRLTYNGCRFNWRETLRRVGLNQKKRRTHELHFHTLRKFFRTQCEGAGIVRSFWDFWMGHKGGYLDPSYFRAEESKHVEEYRKAIPNLTVYQSQESSEDRKREFERMAKIMAEQMGLDKEKISIMIGRMRDEYIQEGIPSEEMKNGHNHHNGNNKQRIVEEKDLQGMLDEGWAVKTALPSGKIVIEAF